MCEHKFSLKITICSTVGSTRCVNVPNGTEKVETETENYSHNFASSLALPFFSILRAFFLSSRVPMTTASALSVSELSHF